MSYAGTINDIYQLGAYTGSNGIGEELKTISEIIEKMIDEDLRSATKGRHQRLYESLSEVYEENLEINWDGYDARPVTVEAYLEAFYLISLLPTSIPLPDEILPEPTGDITFEWYMDKHHVFLISVSGNNILTYAGLFGKMSRTSGAEYYTDSLPAIITEKIQRLFEQVGKD